LELDNGTDGEIDLTGYKLRATSDIDDIGKDKYVTLIVRQI
jgi:hypothetical protein